jgi:hypothetical protein
VVMQPSCWASFLRSADRLMILLKKLYSSDKIGCLSGSVSRNYPSCTFSLPLAPNTLFAFFRFNFWSHVIYQLCWCNWYRKS